MSAQRVPLPIQSHQSLIYLLCTDCDQLHYFRRVPFQDGSQVRYNHPQAPEPAKFVTQCTYCLALQDNDPETVRAAFDHTIRNFRHAAAMTRVNEMTRANLPNRVLACPRCGETCLFSTDWLGNTTTFWHFGMERLSRALYNGNEKEWKTLMAGEPDCGFCEKLHSSEADAVAEAEDFTNEHCPDLNDDPPQI